MTEEETLARCPLCKTPGQLWPIQVLPPAVTWLLEPHRDLHKGPHEPDLPGPGFNRFQQSSHKLWLSFLYSFFTEAYS